MNNQGGSSDKKTSENNITQSLNFMEIDSVHSAKSMDMFTPPDGQRLRRFPGSQLKHPIFNQNHPSSEIVELLSQSSENNQAQQILWGTSININEVSPRFRSFLIEFRSKDDENYMENYYMRQLSEIRNTSIFILNIDGTHLYNYDKQLYYQIINFPTEMIPVMDVTANSLYQELFINSSESKPNNYIQIRIINLIGKSRMRDLGPSDIDKLICISGLVIRNSEIIPEMRDAFFKCSVCSKTETSLLQRSKIIEPNECKNCNTKSSFQIIHNRSTFSDKQHVKLQETPEHMPEGETPITISLCCYDELVDFVKPGDRCEIVGIFRATSQRINPRLRITRSIYRTYIDVVSFAKFNKKRLNYEEEEQDEEIIGNEINQEFKKKLENDVRILSKNPNVYDILVDSFAPSIWENDDVKKGLLLQLFGGVNKDLSKSGRGKFRGDINVLLVGDPSTAKSQFLQYVHNLAPRGIYTSGKGSSVVGLTAYVTKDPETREIVLESGALVLSDRGICCIDEFDKMDDSTKAILHEAMEQQTISIAKAGIICQLNARTAILAAANPIHSKYDPRLSVVHNIRLPPALFSRFDLIYLMLDKHNEAYDRRLANHIVSLYGRYEEDNKEIQSKYLSKELLAAYISAARKRNPILHENIMRYLVELYVEMRSVGSSKNVITATPRQLESIIRLSEARARLRFSEYVEKDDVDEAIRLIKIALQQAATDPETGVIDMGLISTGITNTSRIKLTHLGDTIKNILRDYSEVARKGVKYSSLTEEVKKRIDNMGSDSFTFSEFELRDAMRQLEDENVITLVGNKKAPTIRLIGHQFQ